METAQLILSVWLLLPCHDAPGELFMAGMIAESGPMPEAEARQKFASMTYAEAMEGIEHDSERLCLSLDLPNGQSQQTRTLPPTP